MSACVVWPRVVVETVPVDDGGVAGSGDVIWCVVASWEPVCIVWIVARVVTNLLSVLVVLGEWYLFVQVGCDGYG